MEKYPVPARKRALRPCGLLVTALFAPLCNFAETIAKPAGVTGGGTEAFVRSYAAQSAGLVALFLFAAGFFGWKLYRSGKIKNTGAD